MVPERPSRRHRPSAWPAAAAATAALALAACGGASASRARAGAAWHESSVAESTVASVESSADVAESGSGGESEPASAAAPAAPPPPAPASHRAARAAHAPVAAPRAPGAATEGPSPTEAQRPLLIYTANLVMAVDAVPQAIDAAIELAVAAGGFLAARDDHSVQLRVPASRFREVLGRLERLGDVAHREVQAEDVSEQYHDLEVQLANLRAVRARLSEFLARAANVQEALLVERELERVAAQIDRIEGRLRFLSNRAAYSTVTLRLAPRPTAVLAAPRAPGAPPEAHLPFAWLDDLGLPQLLQTR